MSRGDRALLLIVACAVVAVWAIGGSWLGAIGAVARFLLLFAGAAILLASVSRRLSVAWYVTVCAITALVGELAIEHLLLHHSPIETDEPACYDRQGPHRC